MQAMSVICDDAYFWSTRNHEGKDAYVNTGGMLTVPVRFLFTATSAGMHTCKLKAWCQKGQGAQLSDYLELQAGAHTSLSLSAPLSGAKKWGTENDFKDSYYAGPDDNYSDPGPDDPRQQSILAMDCLLATPNMHCGRPAGGRAVRS